jgi:DNA-binding CsgD family transcriptional regulator
VQNNLGTVELTSGDAELGRRLLTESLDRSRAADLHEHAARAYCNLASTSISLHKHDAAARYLAEGLAYCRERDLDAWTLYLQGWQALEHLHRGDLPEAESCAADMLRHVDAAPVSRIVPLTVLARARARTGRGDWQDPVDRAAALAEGTGEMQRLGPVASTRSEVLWLAGDLAGAQDTAARTLREVTGGSPWHRGPVATWLTPEAGTPPGVPVGELAGPYRLEAAGRWAEAAEAWRRLGSPHERALALTRAGDRAALTEAVQVLDGIGAAAGAARVRGLLRARGWSAPRGPRSSTVSDPSGLTVREAEVLELVSEGLTDSAIAARLVLSRRTVEHHVASILAKLGVASRQEAVATRRG